MPIPSDEGILAGGITVEIPRLLLYAYAYLELVREMDRHDDSTTLRHNIPSIPPSRIT